jgi:4-hydroxy-tetrahydrodipicolinate synthase
MTLHPARPLGGIIPIVLAPFDAHGQLDEAAFRRVIAHELALSLTVSPPRSLGSRGSLGGLGVNGFATEAYKMTDAERLRAAHIAADAVAGAVPLVIGLAAPGLEAALALAEPLIALRPAALMTLPPHTMAADEAALIAFYTAFADALAPRGVAVMVQVSPQIPAYSTLRFTTEGLAEIARRAPNARYFKIEGPGSAARIAALRPLVADDVRLFGGVGGLSLRDELNAGAAGLLPGVGFNTVFHHVWVLWKAGETERAVAELQGAQPLIDAVSSRGHEFSLHARKHLLVALGVLERAVVRTPTVTPDPAALEAVLAEARAIGLLRA